MKVLVAAECMCDKHRPAPDSYDEIVMPISCTECDPLQTSFLGIESGELYERATVIDRPDMSFDALEYLTRACLRQFLHLETEDEAQIHGYATYCADWVASMVENLPVGDLVGREGKRTFSVRYRKEPDPSSA